MTIRTNARKIVSMLGTAAVLSASLVGLVATAPANATGPGGVYIATGHDLDYHCAPAGEGSSDSCDELSLFVTKAARGATPNVLALTAIDSGSCLTEALDAIGVTHHDINVASDAGATEWASANLSSYNVVIEGSIWGADDCQGPPSDDFVTRVNSRSADLIAFYNAGKGIIQMANGGGGNGDAWDFNYYMPVGFHAASVDQSDPHAVTDYGTTFGVTDAMANCCATHNAFINPPSSFQALEVDANNLPVSIIFQDTVMGASGIGGNELNINMELDLLPGQAVEGATVTVSGSWLKADSEWNTVLRSTPTTVCSSADLGNTNAYGAFLCTFDLPPGLEPGTHTVTLTGIAPDGTTLTRVAYLVIDAQGKLVSWVFNPGLAETGVDANELPAGALIGGGLLLAGAVAWVARRRIAAKR